MNNSQNTIVKKSPLKSISRVFTGNEQILIISIIALSTLIAIINPVFFSMNTVFDLLRTSVVVGIIAIGVALVMINGGVDLSCMSIAIFAGYTSTRILTALDIQGPIILMFLIGIVIGAILGFLNSVFIAFFKLPIFVATLGLGVIYRGVMLQFIGHIYVTPANMPSSALALADNVILGGLHITVFLLIGLMILAHILLRYTMVGRGIYAVGGSLASAHRAGYNVKRLNILLYTFAGAMYAIGGVIHVAVARFADPGQLVGTELVVISSVVLGGVSITGGKGTMLGVFLGTILTILIRNNLILVGVPSDWQAFVFGFVLICAITLQAYQRKREQRKLA